MQFRCGTAHAQVIIQLALSSIANHGQLNIHTGYIYMNRNNTIVDNEVETM